MPDDLSALDQLDAPEDWRQIEQRSPGRPPTDPSDARRRIAAAVTAVVVAIAAGTFLVIRFDRSESTTQTPTPTPPSGCISGWVVAPKPYTEDVHSDLLVAESATSPNDVWAVGTRFLKGARADDSIPLIEHWDGVQWQVSPGADTGGRGGFFQDVLAIAPNDVWVVGGLHGTYGDDLIEHWDGTTWSLFEGDPQKLWGLEEVEASSADDVWAHGISFPVVGGESISRDIYEHWDGSSWTTYEGPLAVDPSVGYSATQVLSITPSGDPWAAGGTIRGFSEAGQISGALVEKWNREAWVEVPRPRGDAPISGLAAVNDSDVWALTGLGLSTVGSYGYGGGTSLVHWDGRSWSVPTSVDGSVSTLMVGRNNEVWAFGTSEDGDPSVGPIREGRWQPTKIVPPGVRTVGLSDVTFTSDGTIIAFGSDYPAALGGGSTASLDQEKNYLWVDCA
jgi:hypothetical protein